MWHLVKVGRQITVRVALVSTLLLVGYGSVAFGFPTASVLDSGTGSDANPIAGNWSGPVVSGKNQLRRVSNQFANGPGDANDNGSYWNVGATSSADSEAYATIDTVAGSGNWVEVEARIQSVGTAGADYYAVSTHFGTGGVDFYVVTDGVYTQLGSTSALPGGVSWANGDAIGIEIIGTTITAYYKASGGSWQSVSSRTDSTYSTAGHIGLSIGGATPRVSNFGGGPLAAGPTLEQEGFRWGVDDGNEAAHTWEANQDTNITIVDNQARLLRALVNATGDPASAAYTLRSQKNGSGGYVALPVGATTAGSITNQTIAASSDDAQDLGGTVTLTGTTIGGSLDNTTEWVGLRFTNITIPKGSTITSATIGVVPSATTEDEPSVTIFFQAADDCSTFTTGASDISNRSRTSASVSWSSTDLGADGATYFTSPSLVTPLQEVIDRGGWASGNDVCVIIQGGSTGTRDLTIEAYDLGPGTNPPRISIGWNAPNEVYVTTSANIAAGGEATTARLTAPSGKTTSDFVTGRRWDDENGTDTIDITTDDYTEVEWLVQLSSAPVNGDYFDFRVYAGGSPLDTYTVTPRWTVGSGGTVTMQNLMLMGVGQ